MGSSVCFGKDGDMKAEKVTEGILSLSYRGEVGKESTSVVKVHSLTVEYFKTVAELLSDSRDSSLFLTHLEEALFRAVRCCKVV